MGGWIDDRPRQCVHMITSGSSGDEATPGGGGGGRVRDEGTDPGCEHQQAKEGESGKTAERAQRRCVGGVGLGWVSKTNISGRLHNAFG